MEALPRQRFLKAVKGVARKFADLQGDILDYYQGGHPDVRRRMLDTCDRVAELLGHALEQPEHFVTDVKRVVAELAEPAESWPSNVPMPGGRRLNPAGVVHFARRDLQEVLQALDAKSEAPRAHVLAKIT